MANGYAKKAEIAWNLFAPVHRQHMEVTGHADAQKRVIDKILGDRIPRLVAGGKLRMPMHEEIRVLDVSCGDGSMLNYLRTLMATLEGPNKEIYGGKKLVITANDITTAMQREAVALLGAGTGVNFTNYDATKLEFPANHFHFIICSNTLNQVTPEMRIAILTEMRRVVQKEAGAALLMEEWPVKASASDFMTPALSLALEEISYPISPRNLRRAAKEINWVVAATATEAIRTPDPADSHEMFGNLLVSA